MVRISLTTFPPTGGSGLFCGPQRNGWLIRSQTLAVSKLCGFSGDRIQNLAVNVMPGRGFRCRFMAPSSRGRSNLSNGSLGSVV